MNGSALDRQQIRRAIRKMGNDCVFYLLDDAISLLSDAQLRQLISTYVDPEQFVSPPSTQQSLLPEVLWFQNASLAGEYYEEIPPEATNRRGNSRGAVAWIADYRRLLDCCAGESNSTSSDGKCRAFEILFALLDSVDDGSGEGIVFVEEGGSWMMGIDWKRVLPAWFRVLAVTVDSAEYTRRVERIINRHCHREQTEMLTLARSIETSAHQNSAPED